jgi:hypothetical protein
MLDRDQVLAKLRAEDVAAHLGIIGAWRGRWLRSRRCGVADHSSEAFGLARDGFWHCHVCDCGGDLLALLALAEGLDIRADFGRVLAVAAALAGVDDPDEFGGPVRPAPRQRPELPPLPSLPERIAVAKRRAAWVWGRMVDPSELAISSARLYLHKERGLDPGAVFARESVRETPLRCTTDEIARSSELGSLSRSFAVPGLAVPVRAVDDGRLVDIRIRRFEPRDDQPKLVGMLGGVTSGSIGSGPRILVGCYGHPELVDADLAVITEGALDYLTALQCWPGGAVLGAVEAGSLALVTAHAARQLAARDRSSRLLIVEQADPPRTLRDGRVVAGAADASINDDPNSAAKVAVRILGPQRVGWLFCGERPGAKDLNDLVRSGAEPKHFIRWWIEVGT